jgi:integrase
MSTETWSRLIKGWCAAAGLEGRFSSHTARKTFVRLQHDEYGVPLTTLMHILNHSSEARTMVYMEKMTDDVSQAYMNPL